MPIYKGSSQINVGATTHTHTLADITDAGSAAASDTGDFEPSGAVSSHSATTSGVHGISAFGSTLVDDADASAARTTLGLGTAATSNTGDFAAASHTHALGDLSDVDTAGATIGQVLEFDGADWVPATPSAGAAALNDLTDVSTAGAVTGDVIVYNGSTWSPAAQTGGGEIVSDAEGGVGENSVANIIAITQAEYNALTPQADTFYIITDAAAPGAVIEDSYIALFDAPEDKTYTLDSRVPIARTVTNFYAKTSSGTCTATLKNLTTANTIGTISVTSTGASAASLSNTTLSENDRIAIEITSGSSPADLEMSVEYTL